MATSVLRETVHTSLARTTLNEVLTRTFKYYFTFGRIYSWGSGDTPEEALDAQDYEFLARKNMVLFKEITPNDVCLTIPRYDWTYGQVYDQYDNYSTSRLSYTGADSLKTALFYVLTEDYRVYKCLSNNNNSSSIIKPTGTQVTPFITEDGYTWKYMYTIPSALRSKFLTDTQMPVMNAVFNAYYSGGAIENFTILNKGSKYWANQTLTGTVKSAYVGGAINYFKLYGTGTKFLTDADTTKRLAAGNWILVNKEVRQVASVQSDTELTLDSGTVLDPSLQLYVANSSSIVKLNTYLSVVGDGYRAENPYIIKGFNLTNAGTGYGKSPSVSFGTPWEATTAYTRNQQIASNGKLYTVVSGGLTQIPVTTLGSGYSLVPSVTIYGGGGSGATATANLSGGGITQINVVTSGSLYTQTPVVTISAPNLSGGSQAVATAVVVDGEVTGITINEAGSGYTSNPTITITPSLSDLTGSGATAIAIAATSSIDSITVNSIGSGYTSAPTVYIGAPSATAWIATTAITAGSFKKVDTTVNAGSFVIGKYYKIATVGSTNYMNIGALDNSVGTGFVATGTGSGTGTATLTNYYFVSVAGTTGASAPSHTTGSATNGTATLVYVESGGIPTQTAVAGTSVVGGTSGSTAPSHTSGTVANGSLTLTYAGVQAIGKVNVNGTTGAVTGVTITNSGSGYTSAPTVLFEQPFLSKVGGTGADVEANLSLLSPTAVGSVTINDGGDNYNPLTTKVTFSAPTGANPVTATGTPVIVNGVITNIIITESGSGYQSPPTVTVYDGGTQATGVSYLGSGGTAGQVSLVTITEGGRGYASDSNVTAVIDSPKLSGRPCTSSVTINDDGSIDSVNLIDAGYGYDTIPSVTIVDIGVPSSTQPGARVRGSDATVVALAEKSKAYIEPVVDANTGEITNLNVIDAGAEYSYADIVVYRFKQPGSGTGIDADITLDVRAGLLSTQQANVEFSAINGGIHVINIENSGIGYTASTTITITGDGYGASAVPTVVNGVITKITVTNPGKEYTYAVVTITPESGVIPSTLASARAIISPPNGHGKNAIDELFASTVTFTTVLSDQSINGVPLSADYRQICLVKSPKQYNSSLYYNGNFGTACYRLKVSATPNDISVGDVVEIRAPMTDVSTGVVTYSNVMVEFRVVVKTGTTLVLQAIDNNDELIADGYKLTKQNGSVNYIISALQKPQVDKLTGQMIYIDNRSPFMATAEQPVIISSKIKL